MLLCRRPKRFLHPPATPPELGSRYVFTCGPIGDLPKRVPRFGAFPLGSSMNLESGSLAVVALGRRRGAFRTADAERSAQSVGLNCRDSSPSSVWMCMWMSCGGGGRGMFGTTNGREMSNWDLRTWNAADLRFGGWGAWSCCCTRNVGLCAMEA